MGPPICGNFRLASVGTAPWALTRAWDGVFVKRRVLRERSCCILGVKGESAVDLPRDLLKEFGSLCELTAADLTTFCQARGLGQAKFVQLQACLEMVCRFLLESWQREGLLTNLNDAKQFLPMRTCAHTKDVFACLFLDTKNHVIQFEELFIGTLRITEVHPREVVKQALKIQCACNYSCT